MKGYFQLSVMLLVSILVPRLSLAQPPREVYVTFQPGAVDSLYQDSTGFTLCGIPYIDSINRAKGATEFRFAGHLSLPSTLDDYSITFPQGTDVQAISDAYRASPSVLYVGPSLCNALALDFTPNDTLFNRGYGILSPRCRQWAFDSTHGQFEKAWDVTKGDTSVVIAIIDAPILYTHPDLRTRFWINGLEDINHSGKLEPWASSVGGDSNGVDDDGNGFVDDVIGFDFRNMSGLLDTIEAVSGNYHGTAVASGAAATTGDTAGGAGACPDCRVMAIPALLPGCQSGIFRTAERGVLALAYARKMGADVINMSWHIQMDTLYAGQILREIRLNDAAGIVQVAAAGNTGNDIVINYPAAMVEVLSVAGVNMADVKTPNSSYNQFVDLSAPLGNWTADTDSSIWRYREPFITNPPACLTFYTGAGTSHAAPLVSGVAGLIKSAYPNMTNQQIMCKLKSSTDSIRYSAQDTANGVVGKMGTGRLNAYKALTFFDTIPKTVAETTLSGTVCVSGDFFIPLNKKVTALPGTKFIFYPGDIFNKGIDPNKAEIIVNGTFVAKGAPNNPIQFISFNSTPSDSDWQSVRIGWGGSGKFENCIFKNAYAALDFQNSANDTVKNCVFEKNFMYGIRTTNPNLKILADTFRDNTNYAVYFNAANALVNGCYFRNNKYGINFYKSYGTASSNTIIGTGTGNEFGFRAEGWWNGQTQFSTFNNNLDSGQFNTAAVVAASRTKIQNSRIKIVDPTCPPPYPLANVGILGSGVDSAIVTNSTITAVNCAPNVRIVASPLINLGTSSGGGDNSILRGTGKAIENNLSSNAYAQNNYWEVTSISYTDSGQIFFTGPVVFRPFYDCAPPCEARISTGTAPIPLKYSLDQNYPNPFNPRTTISFSLPKAGKVKLVIYNIAGQRVNVLVDGERAAGIHKIEWGGTDKNGVSVSSGIYFYKMETAEFREVKRMVFLK